MISAPQIGTRFDHLGEVITVKHVVGDNNGNGPIRVSFENSTGDDFECDGDEIERLLGVGDLQHIQDSDAPVSPQDGLTEYEKREYIGRLRLMTKGQLNVEYVLESKECARLIDASSDAGLIGAAFMQEGITVHEWRQTAINAVIGEKQRKAQDAAALGIAVPEPHGQPKSSPPARTFSLGLLLSKELPPARWAVPGLLPEGLIFLAGKPKLGKSWMALGIAMAVASGGRVLGKMPVERGEVLFLALEDNPRRLQKRARKLLGDDPCKEGLEFATNWNRLDAGGVAMLETWLKASANRRLIVIDTFAKVRPRQKRQGNIYDDDYNALAPLKGLADRFGVTVLLIHHLRKMEADDPLDSINGTTGLTGGVDGALILTRARGKPDATLYVSGRDIEQEIELALRFDQTTAQWCAMGDAAEFRISEERRAILDAIRGAGQPMGPSEVAAAIGQPAVNVKKLMHDMALDGNLKVEARGQYVLPLPIIDN